MMTTILRIQWLSLRRDRIALLLTFALPLGFFSIFAIVFQEQGGGTSRVSVAIVDEDGSEFSRRLLEGLEHESSLQVQRFRSGPEPKQPLDRESALALVKAGDVPVAIILPRGLGASFPNFSGQGVSVEILADTSDPVAPKLVGGMMQKVAMTAAPDLMFSSGFEQFEKYAGAMTPEQRMVVDNWLPQLKIWMAPRDKTTPREDDGDSANNRASRADDANDANGASDAYGVNEIAGLVSLKTIDVLGQNKAAPVVSFYAAATGVMFLLFSCSGAGGALLEEVESGTLERLLSSGLGMTGLLLGKWFYLMLIGIVQLTVMFVWGAIAFGLDLAGHLPGFFVMNGISSAAAASFGLVLATACRSRGQLSGLSTIVVVTMSAVGGSMFPRFLMSETMQNVGLLTFNAWALDGFTKVFWRDAPILALAPQVGVLGAIALTLLGLARLLARRWETA